jgi:hypothetical protein
VAKSTISARQKAMKNIEYWVGPIAYNALGIAIGYAPEGSSQPGFLSEAAGGGSYGSVEGSRGLDPGYSGFGSNFGGDVSSGFGFGGFGGFGADY